MLIDKVIIVEGRQDKLKLQPILAEPVVIVCTNGTFSPSRIEELLEPYEDNNLFAFFDEDEAGKLLRNKLKHYYPEVNHLYTMAVYGGVEDTPRHKLAKVLKNAGFEINLGYLLDKG